MSLWLVSVFCQVGFSSKKWGADPYFHTIDGRPYGGRLQIHDGVEYLSPFTAEDLVTGNIPIDLLPEELQAAIGQVIERTILAIERVNPGQITNTQIEAICLKFELSKTEGTGGSEDVGRVIN